MRIALFGSTGLLGTELRKLSDELFCPLGKDALDIRNADAVKAYLSMTKVDVVINSAAVLDNRVLETTPEEAIQTNIIGAANIANACIELNIRLVYISTDYIYRGDRGNYLETDEILPFNFYAWTKLGGECSAVGVKNHLIIRTSFGKTNFAYHQAFIDKWSSKDYVDVIAPLIYEAAIGPITGVLNIGTERKTLFSHARERNDHVKGVRLSETNFFTPYDTSLNLQKWIDYKSTKSVAKPHDSCRVCGSKNLTKYLDLGLMPLANNLEFTSLRAKEQERYPLQVLFCQDCGLSQLSVLIDPEKMFSYYTYRSSVNQGYINHCKKMVSELKSQLSISSFMVDIAGNDGALLKVFKDEIGLRVLNVDPASNLVSIAEAQGITSMADFWSLDLAEAIKVTHDQADLITATNVFAHVDNVTEFIEAAKVLLKPEGVLILEFPYIIDFIEGIEFDCIYFEHLSYFSVLPLNRLCGKIGMKITNVQKQDIHGGTIRVTIAHQNAVIPIEDSVMEFMNRENDLGYNTIKRYSKWGDSVKSVIDNFSNEILNLKKKGFKISAFAASAKGNTLLNSAKVNTDLIDYIVDQTPEKIGKYSPGTGIPIVHIQELIKNPPDYLIILSWNFQNDIMEKCRKIGFTGKFIIPIPEFKVL